MVKLSKRALIIAAIWSVIIVVSLGYLLNRDSNIVEQYEGKTIPILFDDSLNFQIASRCLNTEELFRGTENIGAYVLSEDSILYHFYVIDNGARFDDLAITGAHFSKNPREHTVTIEKNGIIQDFEIYISNHD